MKLSRMKITLGLFCGWVLGSVTASAWDIQRFEGRDYVTLASISSFYGLPPPPPLIDAGGPTPHVALLLTLPLPIPLAMVVPSDGFMLESEKRHLRFELRSREASIDGVRRWFAFPAVVQEGKILISRLDVSKVIEPTLRPEKIEGLGKVETVVLDPGHGGHDRGAISRLGFEKDFALDVARRARPLLEKQGYKVVMTRSADIFVPLHERAAVANHLTDSIFVSIHFNYTGTNPAARGIEIYSMAPRGAPATNDRTPSVSDLREEPGNATEIPSTALAGSIYASLLGQVQTADRGLKHARFAVLRQCTVPATLVECGFVSNVDEVAQINLPAWRQRVAEAIVNGIDGYKLLAEKRLTPKTVAEYRENVTR